MLVTLVRSCTFVILLGRLSAADQTLPVFLSDNHAETFGWISRTFDLDRRYQLVLVDAHSDASAAESSEEIRESIRRVPSKEVRASRVEEWRSNGRIQAFNWIEPLLPRPLETVKWLAATHLTEDEKTEKTATATSLMDGRLEVEPRSSGSFSERWQTIDLSEFSQAGSGNIPVILAIDLDFFAGMEASVRNETFESIWRQAMSWPSLAGVAFSVSRPWLSNDAEAEDLVSLACSAVSRTRGTTLEIDTSLDDRPDDSLKAAELAGVIPRWDAGKISQPLRAIWSEMGTNLTITDRNRNRSQFLSPTQPAIKPDGGEIGCDGVWRFPFNEAPVLRVAQMPDSTGRVRWFSLAPAQNAYDLLPQTGLGKDFAKSPGRWIYETRRDLGVTEDFALAPEKWKPETFGRVRICAEVETSSGWIPSPPVDIRLSIGSGFRAALSECFLMPYVFGISGEKDRNLSGVETGWGSDCSNFLIHAWRRNGRPFTWGDPGRLRAQLATRAENVKLEDNVSFTGDEVAAGIAIDFGRHVGTIWEDREPLGQLGGNDLVAHHLGGFPEITELSSLAKDRPVFSIRLPATDKPALKIRVAGDVVLAGSERETIPGFIKGDATLFMANLEGVASMEPPDHKPRYDFRFSPDRIGWLKERGIDLVSLANNHAADAGKAGLEKSIVSLNEEGITTVGAGKNQKEACAPAEIEREGVRLAVFGICLADPLPAGENSTGVAALPQHAARIEAEIHRQKAAGRVVIVMIHGGDEYQKAVNDEQRKWAAWLVARGVNLIIGSHPHVVQRTEYHAGSVIVHSLGNAVYPKAMKGADSGEVRTFMIDSDGWVR